MKGNSWLLAFALSALVCIPMFALVQQATSEKSNPNMRSYVRDGDLIASHTMIDNCEYIVFKHPYGNSWQVVGVVHDPKCKNCNPPTIVE